MSSDDSCVSGAAHQPVAAPLAQRLCTVCGEALSIKRLQAVPGASKCVPCLTAAGDVVWLKQYDELGRDGEVVTSRYTHNVAIERHKHRLNTAVPSDAAFNAATGDDSHLAIDRQQPLEVGRHLSTEFVDSDYESWGSDEVKTIIEEVAVAAAA